MRKRASTLLISLAYLLCNPALAQSEELTYEVQTWNAPGVLGTVLIQMRSEFPEMILQGWQDDWQLDRDESSCQMKVKRPTDESTALKDKDNELRCWLYDIRNDQQAVMVLPLPDVEVQSWGNRAEESHWRRNHLPKTFQFLNQNINFAFYSALKLAKKSGESLIYRMNYSGPNGAISLNSYTLDVEPNTPYSPSYFLCTVVSGFDQQTREASIYESRCTFNFPDEH